MNRRGFFKALASMAGVAAVAPYLPMLTAPVEPPIVPIDLTQCFGVDFAWADVEAALAMERAWEHTYTRPFQIGEVVSVRLPQRFQING